MKRVLIFLYGVFCYVVFLAVFLYAIGFIGGFGVPITLDSPGTSSRGWALVVDTALLTLFALQHSIMARPAFKRLLTQVIPQTMERSTYVLASSVALAILFWKWEPIGGVVWSAESSLFRGMLWGGYAFGWALLLASTFAINHFDLFGLRQVWRELTSRPHTKQTFATPFLYRIVRHPLYVGWLFCFWSTPTMTSAHLFFAVMTTVYILVAVQFEEADLVREHPEYADYRRRVPMLIPGPVKPVDVVRKSSVTVALLAFMTMCITANAQTPAIAVPATLAPPAGHVLDLTTSASGTQNYVCVPGANGPAWKFLAPQATLYYNVIWANRKYPIQIATHFLSANDEEGGTARPTWRNSQDTSTVWAKAVATSADPAFVSPTAIPWLLLQIVGRQAGPTQGDAFLKTTYMQRVNTTGGLAPATGCDATTYGAFALVPYTADYLFYRAEK